MENSTREIANTNTLKVVAAVEEQYLSTDILQEGVMERPVLPPNLETLRLSHSQKVFMLFNLKDDHPHWRPGSDGGARVRYWQPRLWPIAEVAQGGRKQKIV